MRDHDYVSLLSSLPNPERLFLAKLPPISRTRLELRLKQLNQEDRKLLDTVESVINLSKCQRFKTELEFKQHVRNVLSALPNPHLKQVVIALLEIRTCVVALRKKLKGEPQPENEDWGVGKWVAHINQNWTDDTFKLSHVFAWLPKAKALLDAKQTLEFDHFIKHITLSSLNKHTYLHYFDIEAVIIYVLKWDITDSLMQQNREAARLRFNNMVDTALQNSDLALFEENL